MGGGASSCSTNAALTGQIKRGASLSANGEGVTPAWITATVNNTGQASNRGWPVLCEYGSGIYKTSTNSIMISDDGMRDAVFLTCCDYNCSPHTGSGSQLYARIFGPENKARFFKNGTDKFYTKELRVIMLWDGVDEDGIYKITKEYLLEHFIGDVNEG